MYMRSFFVNTYIPDARLQNEPKQIVSVVPNFLRPCDRCSGAAIETCQSANFSDVAASEDVARNETQLKPFYGFDTNAHS